ncbi:MAG: tRNA lysidine(34) synthetase TilS [Rhodospirillaceae bacterium]|nr:tRNA lysidine(34) synthetase TilS [Rhodospirillaceae bacterium]
MRLSPATSDPSSAAVDADAFAAAMSGCGADGVARLAVAVSGGVDSMALALLAARWCAARNVPLTALIVDHGLRSNSAADAADTAARLAAQGIASQTLVWTDGPAVSGRSGSYETAARAARYRLLLGWCRAQAVDHLALGHQADDQAETFLMRLARGSGLDGLASIAPASRRDGVTLIRPLLGFARARLIATCAAARQGWVEDPDNTDARSQRVRFRVARDLLAREGLSAERLVATVAHLARAQAAIDREVGRLIRRACLWDDFGGVTMSASRLFDAADEIRLRALAAVLSAVGGQTYGPRFAVLARAARDLCDHERVRRTVHGCLVARAGDTLSICREAARIAMPVVLAPNSTLDWDGRFRLTWHVPDLANLPPVCRVVPLSSEVWLAVKSLCADSPVADIAAVLRRALPAICDDQGVVAVPHADVITQRATNAGWRFGVTNLVPPAAIERVGVFEIAPT